MDDLEKLKEIYLADDVDSEDYEDNLTQINEWENEILESENFLSWKEHDVTKKILLQAEETYIELTTKLSSDRTLNDEQRKGIWAKQDACLWIIKLGAKDVISTISDIKKKIKTAINATK